MQKSMGFVDFSETCRLISPLGSWTIGSQVLRWTWLRFMKWVLFFVQQPFAVKLFLLKLFQLGKTWLDNPGCLSPWEALGLRLILCCQFICVGIWWVSALNPGLCKVPSKQIVVFFTPGWELTWLRRLLWGLSFTFVVNSQFFLGRIFFVDAAQISMLHRFCTALISTGFSRAKVSLHAWNCYCGIADLSGPFSSCSV